MLAQLSLVGRRRRAPLLLLLGRRFVGPGNRLVGPCRRLLCLLRAPYLREKDLLAALRRSLLLGPVPALEVDLRTAERWEGGASDVCKLAVHREVVEGQQCLF